MGGFPLPSLLSNLTKAINRSFARRLKGSAHSIHHGAEVGSQHRPERSAVPRSPEPGQAGGGGGVEGSWPSWLQGAHFGDRSKTSRMHVDLKFGTSPWVSWLPPSLNPSPDWRLVVGFFVQTVLSIGKTSACLPPNSTSGLLSKITLLGKGGRKLPKKGRFALKFMTCQETTARNSLTPPQRTQHNFGATTGAPATPATSSDVRGVLQGLRVLLGRQHNHLTRTQMDRARSKQGHVLC